MSYIKSIYKGKLINLIIKKALLPNGKRIELEIISHPGASLIIPFLAKHKVILLRQIRMAVNGYIYELPAGTLNKKESPLDCARREIVEETGYSARKFIKLGVIYPVPGYSTEKITVYKAEGLNKQEVSIEEDEIIESFVVTKSRVRELFKNKKIVDAKTICAFTMCGWL